MAGFPMPFADKDSYQRTLEDGFRGYPKRNFNCLRYQMAPP